MITWTITAGIYVYSSKISKTNSSKILLVEQWGVQLHMKYIYLYV